MEETQYAQLLALAFQARLTVPDARRLEVEAERRQDLRGYFTGLLRQGRSADLTRVAYEIASKQSHRVAEALGHLPPETPVWNALLTISSVCDESDHELITQAIEKWPTPLRVAPASWCRDLLAGDPPAYWRWVRAAKLLREDESKLARVLEVDAMRSIRLLDLSHNDLGDAGVERVAVSRQTGSVHVLLLTGVGCMDAGAISLAEAPHFPQLGTLVLSRNDIEAEGAARLIGLNSLTALHSIDLSVNPIGGEELAGALYNRPPRPGGLRVLNLEDNEIGPLGLAELAKLPHLAEVERLALSGNDFGATGIEALSRARLSFIRSLAVAGAGLGGPGISALVGAAWLPHLRALELSDNRMGDDGLATLLRSTRLGGLEVLKLASNEVTDTGAKLLETHTGLSGLRELDLSNNPLTGEGASAVVANPSLGWLEVLDFTRTCADGSGDALVRALAAADHMRSLERLRLPLLTAGGVERLAGAENLSTLRRLEVPGLDEPLLQRLRASAHLSTCDVSG